MKKFKCEFCGSELSSKGALNNHQKRTKYCLKAQGKELEGTFECKKCDKRFFTAHRQRSHDKICKVKEIKTNLVEENGKLRQEIVSLKAKIDVLERVVIEGQKRSISSLQKDMKEVALKAVSRPTHTTSNKTIQINNYIKNMEPLRLQHIQENVPMLTLDHHVKGAEGYAEYALEFPFKDRIVCVDVARNKIKYKNEEGDIIEDPGFRKMMLKLCDSLKDRTFKLCQEHYEKLQDKFSEEEMDNYDFMEAAKAIHKYAQGRESDFCSSIIRLISKGSKI